MTCIGVVILIILAVSFTLTAVVNPGLPDRNLKRLFQENTKKLTSTEYCYKCKIVKSERTRHCDDCDVCIEGHDHHCLWIGKCIGQSNTLHFHTFLGSTFLLALHIIISVLIPI